MSTGQIDLRKRTKDFALRVIRLHSALPQNRTARVLGDQVLRSATSVGAHYREAHRAHSDAELISKVETGLQELEETAYWFKLLVESEIVTARRLGALVQEANELTAIFVTCVKRAKGRHRRAK